VEKKTEWYGYPRVKKFGDTFTLFDTIHERDRQTPTRTDRHRTTA